MGAKLSPQEFVAKWRNVTLKERSASQSHFNDLCALLGTPSPVEADPAGTWYTFEAGAAKRGGGEGFADVWKRGFFAWEYKGLHASLDKAYEQLLKYRSSLENPPLLIVSDTDRIIIHTNFTNTVERTETITLHDLLDPARLNVLRAAFEKPGDLQPSVTPEQVTQQAAARFAELASLLRKYGEEPRAIAHFLIQLLFCLFAEDARLLPSGVFNKLVRSTQRRPEAFAHDLAELFAAMATGGRFAMDDIAHFDGKLFDKARVLPLDSDGLAILAGVVNLDWSAIEPSILGTLFERSLDPSKRSQLGAHYTSRQDIELIVEPVLMAPLRERWAKVKAQAGAIALKRDQAGPGRSWQNLNLKLQQLLQGFAREISSVRVLDPACGSGNFLYVALRQMLDLWNEVSALAFQLKLPGMQPLQGDAPHPAQLFGIEINDYAHELAQTTVWIGYLQWMHDNGWGAPSEPILKPLQTIVKMDAILAYDHEGRPVEPQWPDAEVIVSNPPFLGDKKMRAELGDKYVDDLRALFADRIPGQSDLCCYWFEKARAMIESRKAKRAGLLATQGIRGTANRPVLDRVKRTGDIFLSWADRPWILDGAAVRVSIIGFDGGDETRRSLDGKPVAVINSDLTSGTDTTSARPLAENSQLCFLGVMKAGPFDLDGDTARAMLAVPVNPNGRPNSDVVKRRLGGQDVMGRPRDAWIIDFGVHTTQSEAAMYEMPFEHVRAHVKPLRDHNRRKRLAIRWWIHGEARPGLRTAIATLSRCIVTPEVARHRVFVWMDTATIPDHKLHVFARDDDYFLGVLQSKVHELWTLAHCSRIGVGNDPSYSSSRTFETFPFPWPPGREPKDDPRVLAIATAARELVEKRDAWLNPAGASEAELKKRTLTNLYNRRPTWLDLAHRKLDEAVFAAYGWPADLGDEEILTRLLALNVERAVVSLQNESGL